MRILLDTHVLLWWMAEAPELPAEARSLIANPEHTIFVSAVSLWEIRLKQSIGKLQIGADFDTKLSSEEFEKLPLSAEQTKFLVDLPWHHRDPFDRMLVAQAKAEELVLLSADGQLAAYGPAIRVVR